MAAPSAPTIEQFLTPGTPTEVVAAKKAERIAWTAYEHGLRHVYTAAAPAGAERTICVARTSSGDARKLGARTTPALSPDGHAVAHAKDGEIYAYEVRLQPDLAGSARHSLGHQRRAGVVPRRIEVRLRQQPRRSFARGRVGALDCGRTVAIGRG
jgi:hypothetical protein